MSALTSEVIDDLVANIRRASSTRAAPALGRDKRPFWRAVADNADNLYDSQRGNCEAAFNCIVRCAVVRVWTLITPTMVSPADSDAIDSAVADPRVRRVVMEMLRRRTDGRFLPDPALPLVVNDATAFCRAFPWQEDASLP